VLNKLTGPVLTRFEPRVSALFCPGETMSDNAMISVYPFGDELYAFTEFPVIHRFDPKTLDTLDRVSEKMFNNAKQRQSKPLIFFGVFYVVNRLTIK
jgi:carotenoid isomerooxygenase